MSIIPQLDAMRLGVDYSGVIKIRGFSLRVRPLSISETVQVASKVTERMMDLHPMAKNRLSENTFLAIETLTLASTSDVGVNDPMITPYIMERMTPDELSSVFKAYVAECDRVNPSLDKMSGEDVGKLVEELKKNVANPDGLDSRLIELSLSELLSVVTYFVTSAVSPMAK